MFKVFITETILRNIIQTESQRLNNSRSNLFKILKSAKNLYVAMDAPDLVWIKQLKDDFGLGRWYGRSNHHATGVVYRGQPESPFYCTIKIDGADYLNSS